MALQNTRQLYGGVTKTFHWLTALLIVTLIPLGIYANGLPFDTSEQLTQKAWAFSLHKTLGVTVFFVALARILWAICQPKPGLLHPDRKLESLAAETVHWLLYGSLLVVPLSGWVHHAATSGFAPIWWPFGQSLPFVPKDEALAEVSAGMHIVFERVLAASILLHIAGALKHHFLDRDVTLRRMLPGTPVVPDIASKHRVILPLACAIFVWAGAISIGSMLGIYHDPDIRPEAVALQQVQSDWQVQEGQIEIAVRQLGSEVTGQFADWTAAITFDDTVDIGKAGHVEVTIAIGSLTLGSVTTQAMTPDFFDADAFPTAQFSGDIMHAADGFAAVGTLTLKGRTVPLTLPFALTLKDRTAQMLGRLTLDRRDFGIAGSMTDEASLGFAVDVKINLTATRSK